MAMARNYLPPNVSARANPFGIRGIRAMAFQGALDCHPSRDVKFHSVLYAIRAMFSLLRFWQRFKGATDIKGIIDNVYWFDDDQRARFLTRLSFYEGIDPLEPFDYRSAVARRLVSIIAKFVSNYDLKDEDVQIAQKMIL